MNPKAVTIGSLTKPYLDDLQVHLDSIADKHGNTVSYPGAALNENPPYTDLITSKRTKQTVDLTLQPYHTAAIRFRV